MTPASASPEKRDEPLNLSLKSTRNTKATIWSPASALEQEEKEDRRMNSPSGRLSPMESTDCESHHHIEEDHHHGIIHPSSIPHTLPNVIDPLQLRLGLRQYRDLMLGAAAGRINSEKDLIKETSLPGEGGGSIASQWCGVWPWTTVYRSSNDMPTCSECNKTFSTHLSLDVHMKNCHREESAKHFEPYTPEADKNYTAAHPITNVGYPTKAEKTFQVSTE